MKKTMPPKSPTSRLDFSRRAEGGPQNIPFKEIRQGILPYEEVDFSGNSLSANELPEVIKICKRCPKLRVLKLFKNCIDDHGAQDLADLCRSAPGLEEIHLSHNMFTAAGATVIIKAAEEYRRPDTVPLWLRLEHNYIEDAERVFQNLQNRYSVCRRTDAKLCAARTCHHRCRVHLPHFCLQRLSQVESNQEPKRSPTHANQHSLFGQCMRKFRADLERENKDKVKIDSQMERMEMRAQPMGDPRIEPFDPQVDDRRPSWTREVSDQDPEDFAGFPAGPPRGPKQKEVHPEQLVDPDSCQEFVCMLCEGVIHDPTLTRCSHSFCSDCFQNWVMGRVRGHLNQTGPKAGCSMQNIPCPQCGQGLRKCDIVPLHHARHAAALVLQRCWSNVRIRCIHHPQHFQHPFGYYAQQLSHHTGVECSWLGNLCDYVSHISKCPVQNYDNGDNWATGGESQDGGEAEVAPVFAEDDICIVLYDYTPDNNPNKIALSEGDLVRVYRTASNGWTGGSVLGPDMQDVGEPGWFPTNLLDRYDERYWAEDNAGYTYEEQYGEHIGHGGELTDANHDTHIDDYDRGFGDSSGEMYDDTYNQAKDKPYPESFEAHYNDFDKSYAQPVDKFGEPFEEYVEVTMADVNLPRPRQYSDPGGEQEYGDSPENAYPQPFEKYGNTFDQPFDKRFVEPAEEAYAEPFSQPEKAFQQPFEKQLCEPYKSFNPSFAKHYGESLEKSYEDSYIQCYDQHYDQWYDDTYVQYGYTM